MDKITELRHKRAKLIEEARAILDAAEGRALTAEEQTEYDRRRDETRDLGTTIQAHEAQLAAEAEGARSQGRMAADEGDGDDSDDGDAGDDGRRSPNIRKTPEYRDAFRQYLRYGRMPAEFRALQVDDDAGGGYLTGMMFVTELLKDLDAMVTIRRLARKFSLDRAVSLGVPTRETGLADSEWTSELGAPTEDTGITFGKRELNPHPLTKEVKVSRTLLRLGTVADPETIVREEFARVFGETEERAFCTGSGSGQPLGVFTASADGIPTGRDVSTGNTTALIKPDGLKAAKYHIKPGYWPRLQWVFPIDAIEQIDKEKDGQGQYMLNPDLRAGGPVDRLIGFPVNVSDFAPSVFTTGLYVGILGDFSRYWIADALDMTIQALLELYARNNQVGFIGRAEVDGMPVRAEAFARVKLA